MRCLCPNSFSVTIGPFAFLTISLTTSAQEAKPDFKFDANDFAKEVYSDGPSALKGYSRKSIDLIGPVGGSSKMYSPFGFGPRADVKADELKGAVALPISFHVELPVAARKDAWKLPITAPRWRP